MISLIKQETQPKITFMIYYQGFLAVASILIFFTGLDAYLSKEHGIGLPLLWMIVFILASVPLFLFSFKRLNCIYYRMPIVIWCGGYLALPLISILILPQVPDLQFLEDQIRTIVFLLLILIICSYHPLVTRWVKLTILLVTLINICMFIYEFFNPFAFYVEQHASGRSSGFYEDANRATILLILGMIFTIDFFKPKYRIFYALFVLLGTLSTFSRGGIIGWFLVIFLFMVTKVIPRYQISLLFLSIFIFISILSTQINNLAYLKTADGTELFNEGNIARVEFLLNPFDQEDDSSSSRIGYIYESWEKFSRHPFIGNGLGSGENPMHISARGTPQRSHNIYLDKMIEYGFLGALLYPWLILASVWKAKGEFKKQALAFAFFLLTQGFFTHTIMSEFSSLSVYAIMANFTKQSRLENI